MNHSKFSKQALRQIEVQQQAWAEEREIDVDAHGCVGRLDDNLFSSLSEASREELTRRDPGLLGEPGKPAEMMRLDSTTALVCNAFDYWRTRDCSPIAAACGFDGSEPAMRLGEALPVAPALTDALAPPVDLLFSAEGVRPTAVVASFAEPYHIRDERRGQGFAFFMQRGLWGPLQGCRNLSLDRAANPRRYRRLDVGELLRQSLALSGRYGPRGFRLLHLWYEVPGHAADQLRREIDRFRMRIGGEVDFESLSWQELFERFRPDCGEHVGYADYHAARYFPG